MPVLCHGHSPGIAVQPVGEDNSESAVRFLIEWVSGGEAEARCYLADHAEPMGASLAAAHGHDVIGRAAVVWESNYAGFRSRGIPLVHQIAVADGNSGYSWERECRMIDDARCPANGSSLLTEVS